MGREGDFGNRDKLMTLCVCSEAFLLLPIIQGSVLALTMVSSAGSRPAWWHKGCKFKLAHLELNPIKSQGLSSE